MGQFLSKDQKIGLIRKNKEKLHKVLHKGWVNWENWKIHSEKHLFTTKVMLVLSLQGHNTIRHNNLSQTIVTIK